MKKGNKYGTHRVISPKGVLPQPADKLDNNMDEIYDMALSLFLMMGSVRTRTFSCFSTCCREALLY